MPSDFTERMHHQNVRNYRIELVHAAPGLNRARLLTLLARAKMAAEENGWPATAD